MAMDRIGASPGVFASGFMGQMPARSLVQPQGITSMASEEDYSGFGTAAGFGVGAGAARGTSDSFQNQHTIGQLWGEKFAKWGGREAAAQALKVAFSRMTEPTNKAAAATAHTGLPVKTYSQWMNLGTNNIEINKFSLANYKATVRQNLQDFKPGLKTPQNLFSASALKEYGQKTLINDNIKPIKDLFGHGEKNWAGALSRMLGFGFLGFDVAKNVKQAHDSAEKNGENTTQESATAFIKYLLRAALIWELAGVGMAFGRAVLPITFKAFPIGGILVGALFAAVSQTLLDPILKTGDHDRHSRDQDAATASPGSTETSVSETALAATG